MIDTMQLARAAKDHLSYRLRHPHSVAMQTLQDRIAARGRRTQRFKLVMLAQELDTLDEERSWRKSEDR